MTYRPNQWLRKGPWPRCQCRDKRHGDQCEKRALVNQDYCGPCILHRILTEPVPLAPP